jgi:hypothetical protein
MRSGRGDPADNLLLPLPPGEGWGEGRREELLINFGELSRAMECGMLIEEHSVPISSPSRN